MSSKPTYLSVSNAKHSVQLRRYYKPAYHYPQGAKIHFREAVSREQCYINLEQEFTCPRCQSTDTRTLPNGYGTTKTIPNQWLVVARAMHCNNCKHAYINAEIIGP